MNSASILPHEQNIANDKFSNYKLFFWGGDQKMDETIETRLGDLYNNFKNNPSQDSNNQKRITEKLFLSHFTRRRGSEIVN